MSKSENLPATSRRPRRSSPVGIMITGIQGNIVSFASPMTDHDVWRKHLKAALGTASDAFVDMTLHHLERAAGMPGCGPSDMAINGAVAMIVARALRDEVEAAFMMVMMARVGGGLGGPHRLPGMASAIAKLTRAYCTQVETYRRLRGEVEQKITVQHVNVYEGGQAIVGAVNSRALDR